MLYRKGIERKLLKETDTCNRVKVQQIGEAADHQHGRSAKMADRQQVGKIGYQEGAIHQVRTHTAD